MYKISARLLGLGLLIAPTAAIASNDSFELWLNPSVSFDLDKNTGLEIETAQRLRSASDGRVDTYFGRLWVNQKISGTFTLSGAIERRINDGGSDETRFIQQVSGKHGIVRTRLRLEQRLVDDADRMGLRLRPRLGIEVPIGDNERWSLKTDAELFWTLRSNNSGGDTGITGLRTQAGIDYDVNDRLSLSLVYLRQQDFNDGEADDVGHAPLFGVEYSF